MGTRCNSWLKMCFGGLHVAHYKVATPMSVSTETTWWCRGNWDLPSTDVRCHELKPFLHLYVHVTHRLHGGDHWPGYTKPRSLTSNVVHFCVVLSPQLSNDAAQHFPSHQHMGKMVQCTPLNHRIHRLHTAGLPIPSPGRQLDAMRPSHVCGVVVDMPGVNGLHL